jgi:tetratricopeptide (TPR) repeat protein
MLPDIDALWDYDDPAASEQRFLQILSAAREAGDEPYLVELLTQIARTQALQRRFDDAHRTLDEGAVLAASALPRPAVRLLLERGRTFNSAGDPDRARPLFLQAWEQARGTGQDAFAVDAAHMLGIVDPGEEGLSWNLRALDLAERSQDKRANRWRASLYNNIGWTYHDAGRYRDALDAFQQAHEWRRRQEQPRETRIAAWCVARALRSLGRVEEALAMQRDNLRQAEAAGDPDGFIQEEIGECLLALDRPEEARAPFARAYAVLSQDPWLTADEPERLQRLKELGSGGA